MSESVLVWSIAGLITAVIVGVYMSRFKRRAARDLERKHEAQRLGIDRPSAQFPFIDPEHCIGCGACVAACPEGDVLGVVGGTAVVINGLRCVGHARCEEVCPVGAIEVGLGDLKSRTDVPQLGESYESSVPGAFVVGELGGLSLVRNAVAQGGEVGQEVVKRVGGRVGEADPLDPEALDVAIVGAGPSGLAAAAVCARAGLRSRVFEREASLGGSLLHYPRRKMVLTQRVELPEWRVLENEEYSKETLLEIFETMVREVGIEIRFACGVEAIENDGELFELRSGERTWRARFVVLALGRRGSPRKLGIPGEELPKVMYKLIDAESYRDRHILVVGGGDSAAEAAIGLGRQPGNRVTLSYRREKVVRVKKKNQDALDRAIAEGSVKPLFSSQPIAVEPRSVRLEVADKGEVEIPNDEVFVFAGGVPPFGLLRELGIRFGGPSADVAPAR